MCLSVLSSCSISDPKYLKNLICSVVMNEIKTNSKGRRQRQTCVHVEASLYETPTVHLPTDRRVGEESLEQPWLRGMRLRLCPSPLLPASTLWAPELMVLRAVLVSTRPGEPLRLPASGTRGETGGQSERKGERKVRPYSGNKLHSTVRAIDKPIPI